jgi:Zn-dependent M28 family amino/carboxypeptidase
VAVSCGPRGGPSRAGGPAADAAAPRTPAEFTALVDAARWRSDLEFAAQPRPPGSPHWQAVQDLCAARFEASGFAVERQRYDTGVNVIGVLPGGGKREEQVLVSAHYDHIPDCEGADDNASGVAGVLEVARVLGRGEFGRTLVVACWDEEESGYRGSEAYAERAAERGERIVVAHVFEMIGYRSGEPASQEVPPGLAPLFPEAARQVEAGGFRGDFVAVVADDAAREHADLLAARARDAGLPAVVLAIPAVLKNAPALDMLRYSDHRSFWAYDVPATMITDTAYFRNRFYHCQGGRDSADRLDADFAADVIRAAVGAVAEELEFRQP